jgi:Zn-dependent protease with chaperone function
MHLLMILATITIAYSLRYLGKIPPGNWQLRWQKTLFLFLFPPLLIFMTANAVICMGNQGKMGGMDTDFWSYLLALILLVLFQTLAIKLAYQGWKTLKSAREYPHLHLASQQIRLMPTSALFAGQIGFWQPELVISQGLLQTLSPEHLESVIAHEQGHYHYRDTFWFFWLGVVRSCTNWLPNTDVLWQELLMLREIRADNYATLQVDPILLAESLLLVVSNNHVNPDICCAALGTSYRLEQRIEALLTPSEPIIENKLQSWHIFLLAFLPLLTVIFHS